MHRFAALCSSLLILVPASLAQADSSTSGSTSSSSSSSSRRVVVINGETVADEETRDGQPVRPGRGPAPGGGAALPAGMPDLDELLERARANGGSYATGSTDGSSHGGGRRIVLRDGEVVLDEEFGDLPAGSPGRRWMDETLEEMLRGLGLDGGLPLPAGGAAPTPPRGRSPIEWRYASTGQIAPDLLDRLGERSGGLERPDPRPYRRATQPMPRRDPGLDVPPLPRRPMPLRTPTQAQGRVIH